MVPLEAAWAWRTADVAAELAIHFAAADGERAIRYHGEAARSARSRFAEREAVVHLRAALEHLRDQPDTRERAQSELACLLDLSGALLAVRGAGSEESVAVHRRVVELAEELPQARFQAQTTLYASAAMRADLRHARGVAEDLLAMAARLLTPWWRLIAHLSIGCTLLHLDDFEPAERHLSEAHAIWRPDFPSLTLDPSVVARSMLGLTTLIRGQPRGGSRLAPEQRGARRSDPESLQPGLCERLRSAVLRHRRGARAGARVRWESGGARRRAWLRRP